PPSASLSTPESWPRPARGPVPRDAGNSSPVAAGCAKPAKDRNVRHIPVRSGRPRAKPTTNWFRIPALPARAAVRVRCAAGRLPSGAACARRARPSAAPFVRPRPVAGPSDSRTADARPPAGPLPPEDRPAGGLASAVRESLGPATGRGRTKGAAEGRARRAQAAPEDSRPAAHRTRTAARAGSAGIRNQFVVGLARGRPDRTGMWRTLQSFAGLAHPAATGLELPASRGTGPRAGRGQDSGVESEALGGD